MDKTSGIYKKRECGAALLEYVLVVALVLLVAATGFSRVGSQAATNFNTVSTNMGGQAGGDIWGDGHDVASGGD